MSFASNIAIANNPVTDATGAWTMLVVKGGHYSRAAAGFAEF